VTPNDALSLNFVSKLKTQTKKGFKMKKGTAFWISPSGDIHLVQERHIDFVANNVELFGITLDEYRNYFSNHNEEIGIEGKAITEMFINFYKKGWILIKEDSSTGWVIELWVLYETYAKNLANWAKIHALNSGVFESTDVTIHIQKYSIENKKVNDTFHTSAKGLITGSTLQKLIHQAHRHSPAPLDAKVCQNCNSSYFAKYLGVLCLHPSNAIEGKKYSKISNWTSFTCEHFVNRISCKI
jgi:hypothetical protein